MDYCEHEAFLLLMCRHHSELLEGDKLHLILLYIFTHLACCRHIHRRMRGENWDWILPLLKEGEERANRILYELWL